MFEELMCILAVAFSAVVIMAFMGNPIPLIVIIAVGIAVGIVLKIVGQALDYLFDSVEIEKREHEKKRLDRLRAYRNRSEVPEISINEYYFRFIGHMDEYKLVRGTEYDRFDPDKDKIFHGVLQMAKIIDEYGVQKVKKITEDIYTYQPRVVSNGGVNLGPYCTTEGMSTDYAYMCGLKRASGGKSEIATCCVPKREIVSNEVFDFDISRRRDIESTYFMYSARCFEREKLKKSGAIKIQYDKYGENYSGMILRPVDLNDKVEREKLNKYLKQFRATETNKNLDETNKNLDEWEAFSNECRYRLGRLNAEPPVKYNHSYAANKLYDYLGIVEDNKHYNKLEDIKLRRELDYMRYKEKEQEKKQKKADAAHEKELEAKKETERIQAENAKIINDYLKWGKTPTVSSPLPRNNDKK